MAKKSKTSKYLFEIFQIFPKIQNGKSGGYTYTPFGAPFAGTALRSVAEPFISEEGVRKVFVMVFGGVVFGKVVFGKVVFGRCLESCSSYVFISERGSDYSIDGLIK